MLAKLNPTDGGSVRRQSNKPQTANLLNWGTEGLTVAYNVR